jgi:hypothetical protein
VQINGIPDSIDWPTVQAFLASIGIDPHRCSVNGIHIGRDSIECDVFAVNEQGHRFADQTGRVAMNHVNIPINRHCEDCGKSLAGLDGHICEPALTA